MDGQGKSVLNGQREVLWQITAGVIRNPQIVEDQTDDSIEALNSRGDGAFGFREDNSDGKAAQCGCILGPVTFADSASIFVLPYQSKG